MSIQVLQAVLDRGHYYMLPPTITAEDLRPRDRQSHRHLEALLCIATMQEELRQGLNTAIVCTRHPSPYAYHDEDGSNNQLSGYLLDLAISPDNATVCLCTPAGRGARLVIISKSTSRKAITF